MPKTKVSDDSPGGNAMIVLRLFKINWNISTQKLYPFISIAARCFCISCKKYPVSQRLKWFYWRKEMWTYICLSLTCNCQLLNPCQMRNIKLPPEFVRTKLSFRRNPFVPNSAKTERTMGSLKRPSNGRKGGGVGEQSALWERHGEDEKGARRRQAETGGQDVSRKPQSLLWWC